MAVVASAQVLYLGDVGGPTVILNQACSDDEWVLSSYSCKVCEQPPPCSIQV